jgi:hypothetical protein
MTDLSPRERSEQALGISQSDLQLIRWAFNRKYGNATAQPNARLTLFIRSNRYDESYMWPIGEGRILHFP